MTSLRGTRDNSNGTVDMGSAGSTTYTGTITFSDIGNTFKYVFDVGSATFYWTQVGFNVIHSSWENCVPVECPLPGKKF